MERYRAMIRMPRPEFVTIEPIMDFNTEILAEWIIDVAPTFVNIGADSKRRGLNEPDPQSVRDLIEKIMKAGVEIRQKRNLERVLA
jgi:hypothetical protein